MKLNCRRLEVGFLGENRWTRSWKQIPDATPESSPTCTLGCQGEFSDSPVVGSARLSLLSGFLPLKPRIKQHHRHLQGLLIWSITEESFTSGRSKRLVLQGEAPSGLLKDRLCRTLDQNSSCRSDHNISGFVSVHHTQPNVKPQETIVKTKLSELIEYYM